MMEAAAASENGGSWAGGSGGPLSWVSPGEQVPAAAASWLNNRTDKARPALGGSTAYMNLADWLKTFFFPFWLFYEVYTWIEIRGTFSVITWYLGLVFINEKKKVTCAEVRFYITLDVDLKLTVNVKKGMIEGGGKELYYLTHRHWDWI